MYLDPYEVHLFYFIYLHTLICYLHIHIWILQFYNNTIMYLFCTSDI